MTKKKKTKTKTQKKKTATKNKPKAPLRQFTVISDTRQKKRGTFATGNLYHPDGGWSFNAFRLVNGTQKSALKTGDYVIKQFPLLICIQRKSSLPQVVANFTTYRKRFFDQVQRMQNFTKAFIICEFPYSDVINDDSYFFCARSAMQRVRIKNVVIGTFMHLMLLSNIHVIFCEDATAARNISYQILKKGFNYKVEQRL